MKNKPNHPTTAEMVEKALKEIGTGRNGISFQAIKKYISANFLVEYEKYAHHIKRYLKNAVDTGTLIQVRGKGASGSFKINKYVDKGKVSKNYVKNCRSVKRHRKMKTPRDIKDRKKLEHHERSHSYQDSFSIYE
ncbi:hypothetical protein NQ318_009651 [Aromia moschata]|uniref:H15 domain-containing protein n=1 Tax=Aromia moschata TaxID=1265417 RepID=A0AAV8Y191_9CUCU|nr:hypothetical protein NQ318_009651 [Aromia moschata]